MMHCNQRWTLRKAFIPLLVGAILVGFAPSVSAQITGATRITSGLSQPVFATHAPGDPSRLFVVEKTGAIKIVDLTSSASNPVLPTSFLSISDTDSAGEGGLLSLAFHPDYQTNGKFYVYVTVDNGGIPIDGGSSPFSSRVREYTVSADPNIANPTGSEVISWAQPRSNHNGGWIGFNPAVTPETEQYLYITSGDGGKQQDPDGNAQDITSEPLGKVLRIDVDGSDNTGDSGPYLDRNYSIPNSNPFVNETGDDEIWAYGLRNPWRASFDRKTGDFWIADVGQNAREEINQQLAGSLGGENYGWNRREGDVSHQGGSSLPSDSEPVYDYSHFGQEPSPSDLQGQSVTGGYVYRGPDSALRGQYIFADFEANSLLRFDPTNLDEPIANITSQVTPNAGAINSPAGFGEDADGNLYVLDLFGGELFRIDTEIQLPGDYDGSGTVDSQDYETWKTQFGSTGVFEADGNGDQVVDAADYTVWRDNLGRTLPTAGSLAGNTVPEPSSILLASLLAIALLPRRCLSSYRRRPADG